MFQRAGHLLSSVLKAQVATSLSVLVSWEPWDAGEAYPAEYVALRSSQHSPFCGATGCAAAVGRCAAAC